MRQANALEGDRSGKRVNLVLRRIDDAAAADTEGASDGKRERGTKPGTHFAILHEPPMTDELGY